MINILINKDKILLSVSSLIFNNLIIGSEIITDKLPLIPNTKKIINKCQLLLALKKFLNLLIVFPYEFIIKKG